MTSKYCSIIFKNQNNEILFCRKTHNPFSEFELPSVELLPSKTKDEYYEMIFNPKINNIEIEKQVVFSTLYSDINIFVPAHYHNDVIDLGIFSSLNHLFEISETHMFQFNIGTEHDIKINNIKCNALSGSDNDGYQEIFDRFTWIKEEDLCNYLFKNKGIKIKTWDNNFNFYNDFFDLDLELKSILLQIQIKEIMVN